MKSTVQFIKAPSGDELAILPRAEYDALVAIAEGGEDDFDVELYDRRKALLEAEDILPAEVSSDILKGENRLKAIRKWKGLTQADVAASAAMTQGFISELESGRKGMARDTAVAIAAALGVPVSWIA